MQILARLLILGSLLLWSSTVRADTEAAGHEHAAEQGGGHGDSAHHVPQGAPPVNWTDMSYADKDTHGGTLDKGDEPMAPPLVLALLNFAIFAGILYWKAGPALTKYLANRHESIKSALKEAAKLQEEAREKLAEYSARIADADAEVNALIEEIRKDAETERKNIVADAERQAAQMRADAESRIESEFLAARRTLEREVVAKAIEVAELRLADKSANVDHGNLFTGFIADLKESPKSQGGQA